MDGNSVASPSYLHQSSGVCFFNSSFSGEGKEANSAIFDVVHQYPYCFLCLKTVSPNTAINAPLCKQASLSHCFIANSFARACRNQQRSTVGVRD